MYNYLKNHPLFFSVETYALSENQQKGFLFCIDVNLGVEILFPFLLNHKTGKVSCFLNCHYCLVNTFTASWHAYLEVALPSVSSF